MLDEIEYSGNEFPLKHRDQGIYWVIQHIFDQQMYMSGTRSISAVTGL
jgi:hypothetical protein